MRLEYCYYCCLLLFTSYLSLLLVRLYCILPIRLCPHLQTSPDHILPNLLYICLFICCSVFYVTEWKKHAHTQRDGVLSVYHWVWAWAWRSIAVSVASSVLFVCSGDTFSKNTLFLFLASIQFRSVLCVFVVVHERHEHEKYLFFLWPYIMMRMSQENITKTGKPNRMQIFSLLSLFLSHFRVFMALHLWLFCKHRKNTRVK